MYGLDLIQGQTEIGYRTSKSDLSITVVSSLRVISLESQEAEAFILMIDTNLEPSQGSNKPARTVLFLKNRHYPHKVKFDR